MKVPAVHVDEAQATAIVRAVLGRPLTVTAMRPLHGGMVNAVYEWATDGAPALLVAKLSAEKGDSFEHESRTLRWYREHTHFPVPEPYGCVGDAKLFAGSCLLMERARGCNLAQAKLTPAGVSHFEEQLAELLAELHENHRGAYGDALGGPERARWLDWFGPKIRHNFEESSLRLSPRAREIAERLLAHLEDWLPECHRPTLIHGDLWATNIIVDDSDPDSPAISAFVDGNALYCDVEYELAYLRVFDTVGPGERFFDAYTRRHALREGFERRCRVYWLNTMLLHAWFFGDEYVPACERLAGEIARLE